MNRRIHICKRCTRCKRSIPFILTAGRQVGHFAVPGCGWNFGSSGLDESQLQCWISCKTVARVGVGSMLHKDLDDVAVARDGCCMEGLQSCQRVQSTSNTAEQRSSKDPSTTEANNGDAVELKKSLCIHQEQGKQNVQNVPNWTCIFQVSTIQHPTREKELLLMSFNKLRRIWNN